MKPSHQLNYLKDLVVSDKKSVSSHLHLISEKVLVIGDHPVGLDDKLNWLTNQDFLPASFTFETCQASRSYQKKDLLIFLDSYLHRFNLPTRLKDLIITCADELITNAFFDAPVENGKVIFKETDRNAEVESKPVTLVVGFNDQELAVSVIDQYGSVNPLSIINHLKKTFTETSYLEPKSGKGAGIGLSLCVKRNTSLLIKVSPSQQSQFTAFFPIVNNFKSYLEKSQIIGLHIEKN